MDIWLLVGKVMSRSSLVTRLKRRRWTDRHGDGGCGHDWVTASGAPRPVQLLRSHWWSQQRALGEVADQCP